MMDEQRLKVYLSLIEQLLRCPQGQKAALLQANAGLVDAGLLDVIAQVAAELKSQGDSNTASWLEELTAELAQALGLLPANPSSELEDAAQFLQETLQLVYESKWSPEQIYPVWAQQQARLNKTLLTVLPIVTEQLFEQNAEQRTFVAAVLSEFADLIQQFPLGIRWINLELSIAAYQQALTVMTQEAMPIAWAETMVNLATAYYSRIRGDRAENLEQTIVLYQQALTVMTKETMPAEWATTMMNLANVYYSRTLGDRAENLEQAIALYQQSLTVMTQEVMPVEWARTMSNLAGVYTKRIQGDRAENLEQAIILYQHALTVTTQEALPVEWAHTMHKLALAYSECVRGDRAENLEQSIGLYQQALTVMTKEVMPTEWATTMMNLANAYYSRIRGDRAENLEQAIVLYQQALTVRTQEAMPAEWAEATMNLANAYYSRIRGDRAENLEQAIVLYQQALTVRTQEAMPAEWATTIMNLAIAYTGRIGGDRAENLEQAIAFHQQALTVVTKEAMSMEWAETMYFLAIAYTERIRGNRAENLEQAIVIFQQALVVRTQETTPVEWAQTMNSLAIAYSKHAHGDRAENLEQTITLYQQALTVMTKEAMPVEWARTMNNLAAAYTKRIQGDRAENLEQAITLYQQALTVMTKEAMPVEWALYMHNLAIAYSDRIWGDRAENLEQAISAFQSSLTVFDPELLPNYYRGTAKRLGNLYSEQQRWQDAIPIYQKALQASETLYQSASLLDSKSAELAETADLPRRAAYALARIGNLKEAVLTLEQGRARGLSETLERDRTDLTQLQQTHPALYEDYQTIAQQLRDLESQQRDRMTSTERHSLTPEALRDSAVALRQQLTTIIQRIRQVPGYEQFLSLPSFADVQKAVQSDLAEPTLRERPLVYLVPTPAGSLALIVTSDTIHDVWLDAVNETQLIDLLNQTWFTAYRQFQSDRQAWFDAIDTVTRQLWESLMAPVVTHLQQHQFEQAILIATGDLSFLPLHAAWTEDPSTPTGRRYALDDIHFTYAPNARSLTVARAIGDRTQADSILAIDNPRQDLPNAGREVAAAIAAFPKSTVLAHGDATVEAVKATLGGVAIAHFSCHGTANLTDPLNSGLLMSDGLLTLRDIFALNLAEQGGLRLAVLSACETGLAGIENADEAVSLPTGLLQAGVAAVIASLWSVSDLSTMLLLSKFYDLWCKQAIPPDQAVRQAQIWLRDTTNEEKIAEFKGFIPTSASTRLSPTTAQQLYNELAWKPKHEQSFAHPFHWAAFNYTGA